MFLVSVLKQVFKFYDFKIGIYLHKIGLDFDLGFTFFVISPAILVFKY